MYIPRIELVYEHASAIAIVLTGDSASMDIMPNAGYFICDL